MWELTFSDIYGSTLLLPSGSFVQSRNKMPHCGFLPTSPSLTIGTCQNPQVWTCKHEIWHTVTYFTIIHKMFRPHGVKNLKIATRVNLTAAAGNNGWTTLNARLVSSMRKFIHVSKSINIISFASP